jgi:hypothetical protein
MTPNTVSNITKNTAIANAYGTKKGRFKTGSLKYSSNLNEKPIGSFSLIKPEMMKSIPTKSRENCVINFFIILCIVFFFDWFGFL